jgi:hypothetical protein
MAGRLQVTIRYNAQWFIYIFTRRDIPKFCNDKMLLTIGRARLPMVIVNALRVLLLNSVHKNSSFHSMSMISNKTNMSHMLKILKFQIKFKKMLRLVIIKLYSANSPGEQKKTTQNRRLNSVAIKMLLP